MATNAAPSQVGPRGRAVEASGSGLWRAGDANQHRQPRPLGRGLFLHLVLVAVLLVVLHVVAACHQESRADCIEDLDCVDADAGEVCWVCNGQRFQADGGCYETVPICREFSCIDRCRE